MQRNFAMSDTDPISDSTPNKRRRLSQDAGKGWDSQNDSGEEFTAEDFETVATMPVGTSQKRKLQYTPAQLHSEIDSPLHHAPFLAPTSSCHPTNTDIEQLYHTTHAKITLAQARTAYFRCSGGSLFPDRTYPAQATASADQAGAFCQARWLTGKHDACRYLFPSAARYPT